MTGIMSYHLAECRFYSEERAMFPLKLTFGATLISYCNSKPYLILDAWNRKMVIISSENPK